MERVPLDRRRKAALSNDAVKVDHVIVSEVGEQPSPSPSDAGHKVARKSVLMRALPSTRFRRLTGKQVVLPVGTAIALEKFEAGLRLAGLMREDEFLLQLNKSPARFVVANSQAAVDVRNPARDNFWRRVHDGSPFQEPKKESGDGDKPALGTEEAQPPQSAGRKPGRTTSRRRRGLDK